MPSPSPSKPPVLLQKILELEHYLSILKVYIDLNSSIVTPSNWLVMNYHQRVRTIFDLEKKYGWNRKISEKDNPYYRKAAQEAHPVLGEYLGLYDLFVPIHREGEFQGMVLTGLFATEEWSSGLLEKVWRSLSGQTPSSENPAYMEFVRIALDTPVLEGPVLAAFREATVLFAQLLSGEARGAAAAKRFDEMTWETFSKKLPHGFWLDWALGRPSRQVMPAWSREVQDMDWVRREIGITRVPTTVITVIPQMPMGRKRDQAAEALQVHHFQRESFLFAKTLPQTVGGRLENYGAVFVTSADPSKGRLQRRVQIEETARLIHRFASKQIGGPVLMGIGETVSPGEPLIRSYRQAVLALHVGRHSGKELVFFHPDKEKGTEGITEIRGLLTDLGRQFASATFADLEPSRDRFLEKVLTLSFRDPEEIRWHLHYALIHLMEAVRQRSDLRDKESEFLHQNLAKTLETAVTTQELVMAFKEALAKLSERTGGLEGLKATYSIERVRDHIDGHFRESLGIQRLAKIAGVSASTFSRRFKKLTGVGLEAYLQDRRLEEAKRLLRTGSLPVHQISRQCGFKSNSYFIQLFGKKTGFSPQKYRKKHQRGG